MKPETKELISNIKTGTFTKAELIDIIVMLIIKMELLDNKVDNLDTVCGYMIKDLNLNNNTIF